MNQRILIIKAPRGVDNREYVSQKLYKKGGEGLKMKSITIEPFSLRIPPSIRPGPKINAQFILPNPPFFPTRHNSLPMRPKNTSLPLITSTMTESVISRFPDAYENILLGIISTEAPTQLKAVQDFEQLAEMIESNGTYSNIEIEFLNDFNDAVDPLLEEPSLEFLCSLVAGVQTFLSSLHPAVNRPTIKPVSIAPIVPKVSNFNTIKKQSQSLLHPSILNLRQSKPVRKKSLTLSKETEAIIPILQNLLAKAIFKISNMQDVQMTEYIQILVQTCCISQSISARTYSAAALVNCAMNSSLVSTIFKENVSSLIFTFASLEDRDKPIVQLLNQVIALLRLLSEHQLFSQTFNLDELATHLINTVKIFPTYLSIVGNSFGIISLFRSTSSIFQSLLQNIGEECLIVLPLQIMCINRSSPDIITCLCSFLTNLIKYNNHIASRAITITDPIEISVLCEFLNNPTPILFHTLTSLCIDEPCCRFFMEKKDLRSFFKHIDKISDESLLLYALNLLELFTYTNSEYGGPSIQVALQTYINSKNIEIQRSVLRVICYISSSTNVGCFAEIIPNIESNDSEIAFLSLRATCNLIRYDNNVEVFNETNGVTYIMSLMNQQSVCRANLIAISKLIRGMNNITSTDAKQFLSLLYGFEDREKINQLNEFVEYLKSKCGTQ